MSTEATATTEVHLAIYDLSRGMARNLSAQFLGPQHAVDIIPHTGIIAWGKEYYFGQGIEWSSPYEFRISRGIHPIEEVLIGHTSVSQQEFEDWCRARAADGSFSFTSYDFFRNNCNNFSEVASKNGLGLTSGVPSYILEMPEKVLSSPMGQLLRPMLDNMQVGHAPTNINTSTAVSAQPNIASPVAPPNPWASITPKDTAVEQGGTPLLDKQQMLLSTDTNIVAVCVEKLHPNDEQSELLRKLSTSDSWSPKELSSVHCYLRSVIATDEKKRSHALMCFRLVVLKKSMPNCGVEYDTSTDFVRNLLLSDTLSLENLSLAYCVLSNAIGAQTPKWVDSDIDKFQQLIDRAMVDCDNSKECPSTHVQISLRQMAAAFIYNSSRLVGSKNTKQHVDELSEVEMSILIGCLERLQTETDEVTTDRLYMALGELFKSKSLGQAAISLTKDLGMYEVFDERPIAKEVASLM
ncbi:hypothetical protein THAOC_15223 [Thalassiosira oceanica]|uniref:PPPDE domain-containing protein n=1 Tax=Thalassiosira oceanica TaxID=159749 RepID=K0T0T3_THAOC|nr:hypothetical protein THAOC_15223 [Thalassiosira oceanica]|eukprot:EJK64077.1 hypothetical protein THAOC_15223 [Thalassiosira oceanica]